ncbi:hypothetical protein T265_02720 [Opisthorchis viverrini]|uniref:Major facilitator superfamily (MFS) profile domain-containing protein n=1 Tax=Opisthorchis viverrini TaxID=6198 RepID=A0A075A5K7_OPIVI|nr:hypothetical protein T265_02720 [Opisthorchis viverrini]KER30905.1 hypothetical protein T265_02720 [Opisthorchis viverrini]
MPCRRNEAQGILPGCASLDWSSWEAEVGFEPRTFRSDSNSGLVVEARTSAHFLIHFYEFFGNGRHLLNRRRSKARTRWTKWLERQFTDRKVRGSNLTSAPRLLPSRLGRPGSSPALVPPSCGMAARHRKSATAERSRLLKARTDGIGITPILFVSDDVLESRYDQWYAVHTRMSCVYPLAVSDCISLASELHSQVVADAEFGPGHKAAQSVHSIMDRSRVCSTFHPIKGQAFVFLATFLIYTCYHLSRKPISVVKSVLHANCSEIADETHVPIVAENSTFCDWKPFDGDNYDSLFGTLDLVFLSAYSVSMFVSGHVADHFHLRHFLTVGSVLTGLATIAFGLGFFLNIHSYAFYLIVQLLGGILQATGWPAVVACMGNWFGKSRLGQPDSIPALVLPSGGMAARHQKGATAERLLFYLASRTSRLRFMLTDQHSELCNARAFPVLQRRGFFMGVWTSHASLGNILGSLIAGVFVTTQWGWSFVVPGLMICAVGILTFFFLVPYPEEVGLESPSRAPIVKLFDYSAQSDQVEEPQGSTEDMEHATLRCRFSSRDNLPELSEAGSSTQLTGGAPSVEKHAVSFWSALRVPGVVEYSFCLFFSKLVSYTFLFWLPNYIREAGGFNPTDAADLSTIFDVGGIIGGILAGAVSDHTGASATVCVIMLVFSVPMLYLYFLYGAVSVLSCSLLLLPLGLLVNGPYALITTAVSADLGTHPSLQSDARALATVAGIIDGTGSVGSALGPLLCGLLKSHGWGAVIAMLMTALALAAVLLTRRVCVEVGLCVRTRRRPLLLEEPIA